MDYFKWDPALETGVGMIDDQHRALFALANALQKAIDDETSDDDTVADALYGLTDYVTEHFGDEEGLMEDLGYPGLGPHRSLHEHLTGEVMRNMAAYFNGEAIAAAQVAPLVADWLRTHIAKQDTAFVTWSKEQV